MTDQEQASVPQHDSHADCPPALDAGRRCTTLPPWDTHACSDPACRWPDAVPVREPQSVEDARALDDLWREYDRLSWEYNRQRVPLDNEEFDAQARVRVDRLYARLAIEAAVRADAAPVDSLDQRAWFMPPDLIDGEAWTREVAVVEMGTATAPYWWVICPQATTLVFAHDLDRHPMRGNGGDDCSAAGCEWDKPHAWAKTVLDERRHPRVAAPVPPVESEVKQ